MLFFYVRHGDPIYNPDGLTERGFLQADALVERFKLYGLDEIYSSTSNRAILTATPTAKYFNKEIKLCPFAHENLAYDEFTTPPGEGAKNWLFCDDKFKQILASREVKNMGENWVNHPAFANTKVKSGVERVNKAVDEFFLSLNFKHDRVRWCYTLEKPNEKRVALFAHGGFGASFLSSVLDIPYPYIANAFRIGHSMVTVIKFDESKSLIIPEVLQLSNDSHLFKKDIISGFNNIDMF